jgi:hypothetical protein
MENCQQEKQQVLLTLLKGDRSMRYLVCLAMCFVSGCASMQMDAVKIRLLDPHPMVDIQGSNSSISLQIDPSIPDSFVIPQQNGITAVPVVQWHQSLKNGFRNGPGKFFTPTDAIGDKNIVLASLALDYVTTAVYTSGVNVVGAAAGVARIRYMARLTDKSGKVLGRCQGEVFSTNAWTTAGGSSSTCTEALEAMYVDITKKLLENGK